MSREIYSRARPYASKIRERFLLTGPGSSRRTFHIALEAPASEIPYQVGDSIGVIPQNDPELVSEILKLLQIAPTTVVLDQKGQVEMRIQDYLTQKANLAKISSSFLKKMTNESIDLSSYTLIDLIERCRPFLSAADLCLGLLPLLPRFYSIASSPKLFPHEIHLTVAYVQYEAFSRRRFGVGSHFLCDLATIGQTSVPIYVQPSAHFSLPEDSSAPIILIGPGTGIAPFRAFLQERLASKATGKNWLFFGERNRATDFYYEPFWRQLEQEGRLRLDVAFSRDSQEKVYVQCKMLEKKKDFWNWLQQGAYVYVCGDANRMAKDVDFSLRQIAKEEGGFSEEEARVYCKNLKIQKRYLLDIY